MTATNKAIENKTDSIDSSRILKDQQTEKDYENQGTLFDNEERKSLGTQNNSAVIFDNKKNLSIFNPRLKNSKSSGQARYGYNYLLKFKCN